ncbi:hypothetical protein GCM10010917_15900 [Paenibacillus physcomitrellae]|uniref:Uncharacterized protein n=1 Tax=Paenibacillus physcomitrellae TaxID=1619311 RepID=A0ABQ1FV07_9BACL|nr:hypothetical protein GCM10010917_15900 [Paenibacillus physcomitrellae]
MYLKSILSSLVLLVVGNLLIALSLAKGEDWAATMIPTDYGVSIAYKSGIIMAVKLTLLLTGIYFLLASLILFVISTFFMIRRNQNK